MVGETNGLAGRLRRANPKKNTFHCVCHRLALATVDSSSHKNMNYIDEVHSYLQ